eukprot:g51399.t1
MPTRLRELELYELEDYAVFWMGRRGTDSGRFFCVGRWACPFRNNYYCNNLKTMLEGFFLLTILMLKFGDSKMQSFPFCGGIVGIACPDIDLTCVDDPTDDCDPANGGADCGGICAQECNNRSNCTQDPWEKNFCNTHGFCDFAPCLDGACEDPALTCVDDVNDHCQGDNCPKLCRACPVVDCMWYPTDGFNCQHVGNGRPPRIAEDGCPIDQCSALYCTPPASFQLCAGRGLRCPDGLTCITNPFDNCDEAIRSECPGVCAQLCQRDSDCGAPTSWCTPDGFCDLPRCTSARPEPCDCNPGFTCMDGQCVAECPSQMACVDDYRDSCTDDEICPRVCEPCPVPSCLSDCPHGYAEINGCPSCTCKKSSGEKCENLACTTSPCRLGDLSQKYDDDGCPNCDCECPLLKCVTTETECRAYKRNEYGCQTCECEDTGCPEVACIAIYCEYGRKVDPATGCTLCECNDLPLPTHTPPPPKCRTDQECESCYRCEGGYCVASQGLVYLDQCNTCRCMAVEPEDAPYNCYTKEVWSVDKQDWCCSYMGLGCAVGQMPTRMKMVASCTEMGCLRWQCDPENSVVKSPDGCNTCTCGEGDAQWDCTRLSPENCSPATTTPPVAACPETPPCGIRCRWGLKQDKQGCQLCECIEEDPACAAVTCLKVECSEKEEMVQNGCCYECQDPACAAVSCLKVECSEKEEMVKNGCCYECQGIQSGTICTRQILEAAAKDYLDLAHFYFQLPSQCMIEEQTLDRLKQAILEAARSPVTVEVHTYTHT